jgi:hypothetical protein
VWFLERIPPRVAQATAGVIMRTMSKCFGSVHATLLYQHFFFRVCVGHASHAFTKILKYYATAALVIGLRVPSSGGRISGGRWSRLWPALCVSIRSRPALARRVRCSSR